MGQCVAERDVNEQRIDVIFSKCLQGRLHGVFIDRTETQVVCHERAIQQVAAQSQGVFLALIFQEMSDMGSGPSCHDPIQPGGAGSSRWRRDDLNCGATLKRFG